MRDRTKWKLIELYNELGPSGQEKLENRRPLSAVWTTLRQLINLAFYCQFTFKLKSSNVKPQAGIPMWDFRFDRSILKLPKNHMHNTNESEIRWEISFNSGLWDKATIVEHLTCWPDKPEREINISIFGKVVKIRITMVAFERGLSLIL